MGRPPICGKGRRHGRRDQLHVLEQESASLQASREAVGQRIQAPDDTAAGRPAGFRPSDDTAAVAARGIGQAPDDTAAVGGPAGARLLTTRRRWAARGSQGL
jgi:hypothetical protein